MKFVSHHVAIINIIYSLCVPQINVQVYSPYLCFQMAEEGWTQGNCQVAPGFPSLLINALESLGITECPRHYSREYEHHGTLHCRVILVIARSDRYPDIQPWRVTATEFRHQDTYP